MMNSTPDEFAVTIRDLRVRRGGHDVLRGLDLDVPRASITGLLGPSGGGKTTLMRAIVGSQIVAGGTVDVLGLPAGSPELRGRVGYVTQSPSVYPDLSVADNIRYFAALSGGGAADVADAIAVVDLVGAERRLVADLSGGQHSRVSLACALVAKPELLVLDEPTVGLDPVLRAQLWQTFADLAATGVTLIVSSHVMDEAERCDGLLLLRDGALVATTTAAGLRRDTGRQNLEDAFLALVQGAAA